eukprot:m51a1_g11412 hypothetical protein (126) ;mRNA; r:10094-12130
MCEVEPTDVCTIVGSSSANDGRWAEELVAKVMALMPAEFTAVEWVNRAVESGCPYDVTARAALTGTPCQIIVNMTLSLPVILFKIKQPQIPPEVLQQILHDSKYSVKSQAVNLQVPVNEKDVDLF